MMKQSSLWFLTLFLLLFSLAPAEARDPQSAQERMRERLTQVDALKRAKLVGETNLGLLEARREITSAQQRIVREENQDRRIIYDAIAERQGIKWQQVGTVRAKQIAERSARGILLQNEKGEWYEK